MFCAHADSGLLQFRERSRRNARNAANRSHPRNRLIVRAVSAGGAASNSRSSATGGGRAPPGAAATFAPATTSVDQQTLPTHGDAARRLQQQAVVQPPEQVATSSNAVETARVLPQYRLVSPLFQPLVGNSRQHAKIEHQVKKAAGTSLPLLITGEAGLHTVQLAATIHTLGLHKQDASHPLVVVDCATVPGQLQAQQLLQPDAAAALAAATSTSTSSSSGSSPNEASRAVLMAALQKGTLVLHNLHKAPDSLLSLGDAAIATLLPKSRPACQTAAGRRQDAAAASIQEEEQEEEATAAAAPAGSLLQACGTRLVLISQQPAVQLQQQLAGATTTSNSSRSSRSGLADVPVIAVPPLRSRASDIAPLALQAAAEAAELRGYAAVQITDAAVKRLTSYHFPYNQTELEGLVQRAVMLHPPADAATGCAADSNDDGEATLPAPQLLMLDDADFWQATEEADKARIDVLELMPWMRSLLLNTGLWPEGLNRITRMLYPLIIAALFLGPQDREHSAALTVFWGGWWPLVFISYPFIGRAWCAICPFMLTGREAQQMVTKDGAAAAAPAAAPTAAAAASASSSGTPPAAALAAAPPAQSSVLSAVQARLQRSWRQLQQLTAANWGWQLRKWPAEQVSAWGGWFLLAAFAGILVWEEVWDLPNSAALSGWLLLLITGGAVACSVVYEKRLWCRYLCPVGGMNGLMAKLSLTEIRSRPGICAASGCSRHCHQGRMVVEEPAAAGSASLSSLTSCSSVDFSSAAGQLAPVPLSLQPAQLQPSGSSLGSFGSSSSGDCVAEPQVTFLPGCPMNTYPAKLVDNHDCVMCGNCLRSCPNGSSQWRVRLPAVDLWSDHSASWQELNLMYLLLGAVFLHRLPELCEQLGVPTEAILSERGPHLLAAALLLAAPAAAAWAWDKAGHAAVQQLKQRAAAAGSPATAAAVLTGGKAGSSGSGSSGSSRGVPFLRLAYSLLPLVWAGTLAHYEDLLLTELGLMLPRLALSLGAPADATWLPLLPAFSVSPSAVDAVQGCGILLGGFLSWVLAGKIAAQAVGPAAAAEAALPQRIMILAVAAELWRLIV